MTEKTATAASQEFWQEFKSKKQEIDGLLEQSNSQPKSTLKDHFSTILQSINDLEKRLTTANAFIPSYDEFQYTQEIKGLMKSLEEKQTELTPRPKFSFKSRKKNTLTAAESPTTPEAPIITKETNILGDATVLFSDKKGELLTLKDHAKINDKQNNVDILLSNLDECVILLENKDTQISAVHIKNVNRCLIYCGSIEGSILMYGLTHSTLFVDCHQFRMHDSKHVDIMLHVTSHPIIENSASIQVGCLDVKKDGVANYFNQIEDFNWLKKQASPNWQIMDQNKQSTLSSSKSMFSNIPEDPATLVLTKGLSMLPI